MREIKFRAWEPKSKTLTKAFDLEWLKFNTHVPDDFTKEANFDDDLIFQQFTGLKDKNGTEIYEGDVYCLVEDSVVENIGGYVRTEPEGRLIEVKIPEFYHLTHYEFEAGEGEVIGNIYENPELLNA